jgi:Fe-S cluster assembly protein SufB
MAYTEEELKKELETKEYEYGFYTDIESDTFAVGLNEDIIRKISEKKGEPEWMTEWRLDAFSSFKKWLNLIGQM